VVVGSLLISLLRNSDRVTAACLAQLVNVIAPIRTEPGGAAWRQTIFHPFATTAKLAQGNVLAVGVGTPSYETPRYGDVPTVDAVATHDPETGEVTVFAVNRHQSEPASLTIELGAFGGRFGSCEVSTLTDDDLSATNTEREPDRVTPQHAEPVPVDGTRITVVLPRVSWSALRLRPAS
jgi:alpha-N-arabinofuranosidase